MTRTKAVVREKCWVRVPDNPKWGYQIRCGKPVGHEGAHATYGSITIGAVPGIPEWTHVDEWPFETENDDDVVLDPMADLAEQCDAHPSEEEVDHPWWSTSPERIEAAILGSVRQVVVG